MSIEQENNSLHAYLVTARAEQKSKSGTFWHSHTATYMCGTDDLGLVHTATEVRVKGSKDKNTRVKHVRGHQTSSFIQFATLLAPLLRNGTCWLYWTRTWVSCFQHFLWVKITCCKLPCLQFLTYINFWKVKTSGKHYLTRRSTEIQYYALSSFPWPFFMQGNNKNWNRNVADSQVWAMSNYTAYPFSLVVTQKPNLGNLYAGALKKIKKLATIECPL